MKSISKMKDLDGILIKYRYNQKNLNLTIKVNYNQGSDIDILKYFCTNCNSEAS